MELLDSCIDRIEQADPVLNDFPIRCLDRARDEARAAEAAVMTGSELGPLHGLPLGVKDLNDQSGVRTTQGSRMFENVVPDRDDSIVAAMRQAGAVAVGKTNVPEHGFGATTSNPLFGHTGNPCDPALSAGVSTGGGTAALAARMVPLAIGSDFACGSGSTGIGHGNARILGAVRNQLESGLTHVGPHFTSISQVRLYGRLRQLLPDGLNRFHPATIGTEAVESALKTAMHFTGRRRFLAFRGGYHSRSSERWQSRHPPARGAFRRIRMSARRTRPGAGPGGTGCGDRG